VTLHISLPFPSLPFQFSSVQFKIVCRRRLESEALGNGRLAIANFEVPDSVSAREPLLSTIIPFELLSFRIQQQQQQRAQNRGQETAVRSGGILLVILGVMRS